jgi:hypothetical protein
MLSDLDMDISCSVVILAKCGKVVLQSTLMIVEAFVQISLRRRDIAQGMKEAACSVGNNNSATPNDATPSCYSHEGVLVILSEPIPPVCETFLKHISSLL